MSKQDGECAGTHVAGEVVEAQHHDEDHHCHRVLRRHQGQPAGQSNSPEGTQAALLRGVLF